MSSAKKLQADIDKTLKKINDGIDAYEQKWELLMDTDAPHLKEKYESDLKKELKRLQKLRELVKNWANSSDVKQKEPLYEARSKIERRMERFKALERESKTKAYSKQGLMREDEPDDPEKAATREWLNDMLRQLATQTDEMEAELEQEQRKRKPDADTEEELESCINTNRWYTERLEQLVRLLDNDAVEPPSLEDLQDLVADHLDRGRDADYVPDMTVFEDFESLFVFDDDDDDDEDDDEDGGVGAAADPSQGAAAGGAGAGESSASSAGASKAKKSKAEEAEEAAASARRSKLKKKAAKKEKERQQALAAKRAVPVPPVDKAAPASTTASNPTPASAQPPRPIAGFRSAVRGAAMAQRTTPTPVTPAALAGEAAASPGPQLAAVEQAAPKLAPKAGTDGGGVRGAANGAVSMSPLQGGASHGGAPDGSTASRGAEGSDLREARRGLAQWTLRGPPADAGGMTRGMSLEHKAEMDLLPEPMPLEAAREALIQMQATASRLPSLPDVEPPAAYMPRRPAPGHSSFPSRPLASLATPAMTSRMTTQSLFFVFYMQQGTFAQYLAARELRKRSWRFHRKYLTWFQRHEKPEVATKTYEKGSYLFFDYEQGWCQNIVKDFVFEYAHLEDELK